MVRPLPEGLLTGAGVNVRSLVRSGGPALGLAAAISLVGAAVSFAGIALL